MSATGSHARSLLCAIAAATCAALALWVSQSAHAAVPPASADIAVEVAAWADSRSRVAAFPSEVPPPLVDVAPSIDIRRGEALVAWEGEVLPGEAGPTAIALRITPKSPRRALADCRLQGHAIRTRIIGGGRAITSCRGDMSRFQAVRGYGGWTYVASSKYYGGITGAQIVRLLLSLEPQPAPPRL